MYIGVCIGGVVLGGLCGVCCVVYIIRNIGNVRVFIRLMVSGMVYYNGVCGGIYYY